MKNGLNNSSAQRAKKKAQNEYAGIHKGAKKASDKTKEDTLTTSHNKQRKQLEKEI